MECVSTRWFSRSIVAILLVTPAAAKADPFGLVLEPNPPTAVVDGFKYEYTLQLSADERFTDDNSFTIFDFAGYVPGSIGLAALIASDWTVSVQDFGPGVPAVAGPGNPETAVTNLVFTYNGDVPLSNATVTSGFYAVSTHGAVTDGQYSASHERNVLGTDQTKEWKAAGSTGVLYVPAPEPGSIILVGTVAPLGLYYLVRRRRAAGAR